MLKISSQKPTETPQTPHSELISSTLTPNRFKQISSLRNTLGELEAEFTQHKLISDGDIQQLKDKLVQQDNVLKLQNKQFADLASDLSSQVTSLNDLLQQNSTQMKKLQDENLSLHKKNSKLLEANAALQAKHRQLETDVAFLKDQMVALWQKSADAPAPVSDADDKQLSSNLREPTQDEHLSKPATVEQELLLVDLSTQNRFSLLLQEETLELNNKNPLKPLPPERHARNASDDKSTTVTPGHVRANFDDNNTRDGTTQTRQNNKTGSDSNTHNLPPGRPAGDGTPPNTANTAVFLCDSNGRF